MSIEYSACNLRPKIIYYSGCEIFLSKKPLHSNYTLDFQMKKKEKLWQQVWKQMKKCVYIHEWSYFQITQHTEYQRKLGPS